MSEVYSPEVAITVQPAQTAISITRVDLTADKTIIREGESVKFTAIAYFNRSTVPGETVTVTFRVLMDGSQPLTQDVTVGGPSPGYMTSAAVFKFNLQFPKAGSYKVKVAARLKPERSMPGLSPI